MVWAPLITWFSASRGDHFTTTHPDWRANPGSIRPGSGDYQAIRIEGFVETEQMPDMVPLYHWWSEKRQDNFLTSDSAWAGAVGAIRHGQGDYRLFRIEGYIWRHPYAGTKKLVSYWNPNRKDNAASAWPLHRRHFNFQDVLEGEPYTYVSQLGYVALPGFGEWGINSPTVRQIQDQDSRGLEINYGLGRWRPQQPEIPVVLLVLDRGTPWHLQAAFSSGVKSFFFAGNQYLQMSNTPIVSGIGPSDFEPSSVDAYFPRPISDWRWGDFGRAGIDATLMSGTKLYFFSGKQYIRVTRTTDTGPGTMDDGYPKSISTWGWGNFGRDGIDAAFRWGSKTYFFSGNQYIRVTRTADFGSGTVDAGYPRSIREWGWGNFGRDGIDAAFDTGTRTFVYSGDRFLRITHSKDIEPGTIDATFPKLITTLRWPTSFPDPMPDLVFRYQGVLHDLTQFSEVMSDGNFRYSNAGVFRSAFYGDDPSLERLIELASEHVDLGRFAHEGRITSNDLQIIAAIQHGTSSAQHNYANATIRGITITTSVIKGGPSMGHSDLAHELLHGFSAVDLYGPLKGMNIKGGKSHTLMAAHTGKDGSVLLDPWHRMQFGWKVPQVVAIESSHSDEVRASPSQTVRLRFHDSSGHRSCDTALVIPWDSLPSETNSAPSYYFMLEARRNTDLDHSAPGTGLVVWYIEPCRHDDCIFQGLNHIRPDEGFGTRYGFVQWPRERSAAFISRPAQIMSGRTSWMVDARAGETSILSEVLAPLDLHVTVDMEVIRGENWLISRDGSLRIYRPGVPGASVDGFVEVESLTPSGWQVRCMTQHNAQLFVIDMNGGLWVRSTSETPSEWRSIVRAGQIPGVFAITATDSNSGGTLIWIADADNRLRVHTLGAHGWLDVGDANNSVLLATTSILLDRNGTPKSTPFEGLRAWIWGLDRFGTPSVRAAATESMEWLVVGDQPVDISGELNDFMILRGPDDKRLVGLSSRGNKLIGLISVDPRNHNHAALVVGNTHGVQVGTSAVFKDADGQIRLARPPRYPEEPKPQHAGLTLKVWPFNSISNYVDVSILPTVNDQYRFRPFLQAFEVPSVRVGSTVVIRGIMPIDAQSAWQVAIRNPNYIDLDSNTWPEITSIPRVAVTTRSPSMFTSFVLPMNLKPGKYFVSLVPTNHTPSVIQVDASNEIPLTILS